ncbi:MAG TPA: YcjX family protein [Propylenella sp.]|nr:YcjX family protein [Propylenella sp.]
MAAIATITDEAKIAADNLLGTIMGGGTPTVRLGVTGLSRAGKTVFITALVHNLVHGGRLPLFDAFASGRLAESRLMPQPDDDVPRFDYEAHVRDLVDKRVWPSSTRRISELRIVIDYESARALKRTFGRGRLNLDIVDYPGEWLLDLALLKKTYAEWSVEALGFSREPHRQKIAAGWQGALAGVDPSAPEDEEKARQLAETFTSYLRAARADEHALSMLPPGRLLMPGDMEGSPALTFAPLDLPPDYKAGKETLAAMMERRYEAYKTHVVKPFFRDHFARLDRQIVLVDMLAALNAGPAALHDLEAALADVLAAFRPGRASWLRSILTRKIDRILFAATKADHVHHSDHDNLARMLRRLTRRAAERAAFAGAEVRVVPLAAVRATREVTVKRGGEKLPAIAGVPMAGERVGGETYDGETEIALFPGDLPDDPEAVFHRELASQRVADEALALRFLRFRPPRQERTAEGVTLSLPHIRLDQILQYLIGDKLQ